SPASPSAPPSGSKHPPASLRRPLPGRRFSFARRLPLSLCSHGIHGRIDRHSRESGNPALPRPVACPGSVPSQRRCRCFSAFVMRQKQSGTAALTAEAHHWAARRSADPYDRTARENLARVLFAMQRERFPLGTIERGQHLLSIIGDAFPI